MRLNGAELTHRHLQASENSALRSAASPAQRLYNSNYRKRKNFPPGFPAFFRMQTGRCCAFGRLGAQRSRDSWNANFTEKRDGLPTVQPA
jgi:hypothetical protein